MKDATKNKELLGEIFYRTQDLERSKSERWKISKQYVKEFQRILSLNPDAEHSAKTLANSFPNTKLYDIESILYAFRVTGYLELTCDNEQAKRGEVTFKLASSYRTSLPSGQSRSPVAEPIQLYQDGRRENNLGWALLYLIGSILIGALAIQTRDPKTASMSNLCLFISFCCLIAAILSGKTPSKNSPL